MRTFLIGLSIVLGSAALPVWLFLMYKVLAAVGETVLEHVQGNQLLPAAATKTDDAKCQ